MKLTPGPRALLLAAALVLTGCADPTRVPTGSSRAEVLQRLGQPTALYAMGSSVEPKLSVSMRLATPRQLISPFAACRGHSESENCRDRASIDSRGTSSALSSAMAKFRATTSRPMIDVGASWTARSA